MISSNLIDSLPEPFKIKIFLSSKCLNTPSCELNFVDDQRDIRIKMILRNVQV